MPVKRRTPPVFLETDHPRGRDQALEKGGPLPSKRGAFAPENGVRAICLPRPFNFFSNFCKAHLIDEPYWATLHAVASSGRICVQPRSAHAKGARSMGRRQKNLKNFFGKRIFFCKIRKARSNAFSKKSCPTLSQNLIHHIRTFHFVNTLYSTAD